MKQLPGMLFTYSHISSCVY